jgi:uncharacterized protein involved in exopolysaccharide biosynthesis
MAVFGLGKKRGKREFDAGSASRYDRRSGNGSTAQNVRKGDLTVADYAHGVPNIRLSEAVKSFGRQLKWLIPLFILGVVVAWFATKDFKRSYSAHGSLMVQLGDEYVYQGVGSQNAQNNLQITSDTITRNEMEIIKNPEVIDAVIGQMTSTPAESLRFDEAAEKKIRSAGNDQAQIREAQMERRNRVESAFVVMPQPKSSIIQLVYKHEDPAVAVETLNAFMDTYRTFRRSVFVEGAGDVIAQRRKATEQQLDQNEQLIANFLEKNNVSDFESEQEGVQERTEDLKASLNSTRADISETEAALAEVEDQLRQTPQTIDIYRDDRASQRIAQAELELGQLLAKYLPTSDPVRQKRAELEELRSVQSGYGGQASGGRRVGPNPVFQELATRRNTLQASANSLREKEFTLQRQLDSADAKVRRLTQLYPKFQNLMRERETLADRLNTYNTKEQEALINQTQSESNNENIREISRARYAIKGRNLRILMFALAVVGWGFTLFMVAMARVFLDPRLYTSKGAANRQRRDTTTADPVYGAPIPEPVTPQHAPKPYEYADYEDAGYGQTPAQPYSGPQTYQDNAGHYETGISENYPADPYRTTGYDEQAGNNAPLSPAYQNSHAEQSGPVEWTPSAETYTEGYPQAGPAPQQNMTQGYGSNGSPYAEPQYPQSQGGGHPQPYSQNPYSN